jgi:hypothetical protein
VTPREAKAVKLLLVLVAALLVAGIIVHTYESQRAYSQETCERWGDC